jgi:magnesium-transporting ATPase (P-type)
LFARGSPFNSRLKWMKTIHAPPRKSEDQRRMAVVKGAPERILECCTHYMHKGESAASGYHHHHHHHHHHRDQRRMAVVKGAPERILECCTHYSTRVGDIIHSR